MIEAALLILAQKPFLEHRLGSLFCAQKQRGAREDCLRFWSKAACGCG